MNNIIIPIHEFQYDKVDNILYITYETFQLYTSIFPKYIVVHNLKNNAKNKYKFKTFNYSKGKNLEFGLYQHVNYNYRQLCVYN